MTLLANPERQMLETIAAALEPPEPIDLLSWAEANIAFDDGPFQGPYSRTLFPFFDAILRALSPDDPCRIVTLSASAQVGKTTLANIFTLASICLGRGSFLYVHPSNDNALRWSKMKLSPLMRSTAGVSALFPQRANDSQASILYKERRDGLSRLLITGANSPSSLSQVTIDAQVQDDLVKFEPNSAGDPEAMADSRSRAIAAAKIFKISTPLIMPGCRITKNFTDGSQEMPFVPCPHCGAMQVLRWENMLAALDPDHPEDACFTCVECAGVIEEHHRPQMLAGFEWRAANPTAMTNHRSFWIWSAYSYLQSWEQIAREWLKARGDPDAEKTFSTDTLGLAWEAKGTGRPWKELATRAAISHYERGVVPQGALVLTLGVDCQLDRVEWQLVGFGREYRRFVVDYGVIERHIAEPDCQRNLDLLLERKWPDFRGADRGIMAAAIDGNYSTDDVLLWARKWPANRLIVVRGLASDAAPRIAKVQRERDEKRGALRKHGGRFYNLNTSTLKMSLYRDLDKTDPVLPGYVSFPSGCEDRYFQELVSEERIALKRMGYTIYRWVKPDRQANEMLDTMIYASAAALKGGVNGISDQGWSRLEATFECGPHLPVAPPPRPNVPADQYEGAASAPVEGWVNGGATKWW
ncbi:phage terminase large subunit family protein [Methylocella sp.]|jgi:phage terminase large subunit GpA-like protein|uniref:phage terminase large subunit family protein n=1 Tax=Methylocella sp. TaxID=1978226 RepID=UPI003C197BE1